MPDTRRKSGRRHEFWVRDWHIKNGWSAYACGKKALKFGGRIIFKGDDIFGTDVIAVKRGELTRFIQVTADSGVQKRLDQLRQYSWNPDHQEVFLYLYRGKGRWTIKQLSFIPIDGPEFRDVGEIRRGKFIEAKEKP